MHQDYTHSHILLEIISVLITLTLTPLIVFGINFKSVIGNWFGDQLPGCVKEICISPPLRLDVLLDYTYTPEITLTLLNCFQINFQNITLTLLIDENNYECNLGAPKCNYPLQLQNWSFFGMNVETI